MYDYNSVVTRPGSVHYPVQDLGFESKISCLKFSDFHRTLVASCNYDGAVNISDIETGTHIKQWWEHEKSCWSVDFNHSHPLLLASGSDDFKIRIWKTNMPHSVGFVNAEANVCSVQFHPASC